MRNFPYFEISEFFICLNRSNRCPFWNNFVQKYFRLFPLLQTWASLTGFPRLLHHPTPTVIDTNILQHVHGNYKPPLILQPSVEHSSIYCNHDTSRISAPIPSRPVIYSYWSNRRAQYTTSIVRTVTTWAKTMSHICMIRHTLERVT